MCVCARTHARVLEVCVRVHFEVCLYFVCIHRLRVDLQSEVTEKLLEFKLDIIPSTAKASEVATNEQ